MSTFKLTTMAKAEEFKVQMFTKREENKLNPNTRTVGTVKNS